VWGPAHGVAERACRPAELEHDATRENAEGAVKPGNADGAVNISNF
jgi:hypothetical protein